MPMLYGYVHSDMKPLYLANVVPTLDAIEIPWDPFPSGIAFAKAQNPKPTAKFLAYKVLTLHTPGWDKCVTGTTVLPDGAFLHHKNGDRWRGQEIGYQPQNPTPFHFLNPKNTAVVNAALADVAALAALGYHGRRYDETILGWGPHNAIDYTDCLEYVSADAYRAALVTLLGKIREAGAIQIPSIMQTHWPEVLPVVRACRAWGLENFPAGTTDQGDIQRTVEGFATLGKLLSRTTLSFTIMGIASSKTGMSELKWLTGQYVHQFYVSLDALRNKDTGEIA